MKKTCLEFSSVVDPVSMNRCLFDPVRDVQSGAYFIWWRSGSGFQNLFVQGWKNLDPGSRIGNIGVSQINTRYSDPDLKSDWIGNSMPGLKLLIRDLFRGHPEKKSFRSATLVRNAEFGIRDILVRIRIRFRYLWPTDPNLGGPKLTVPDPELCQNGERGKADTVLSFS